MAIDLETFDGWDNDSSMDLFAELEQSDNSVDTSDDEMEGADEAEDTDSDDENIGEGHDSDEEGEEEEEPSEKEVDLFKQAEEEEEDEDEDPSDDSLSDYKKIGKVLFEKGLIDLEEGEDIPEEGQEDFIIEKLSNKVDDTIEEMLVSLPEPVKQLNRYILNGGDVETFMKEMNKSYNTEDLSSLDIDKEQNQKKIMKAKLEKEGYDDDYISAQLEFLVNTGNLSKLSRKEHERIKTEKDGALAKMAEDRKQQRIEEERRLKEDKINLTESLKKTDAIGELEVSLKDKTSLPSYIKDKNIKLKNGTTITEFQKDLFSEVHTNEKLSLQLAILLKNRNPDGTLNFDSIKRKVKTQETKKFKKDLRRSSKNSTSSSSESGKRKIKPLWEYYK